MILIVGGIPLVNVISRYFFLRVVAQRYFSLSFG